MKVLFASWELDPFFKFGGLGDVARSLPFALKEEGVDIRNVLPFYQALKLGRCKKSKVGKLTVEYDKVTEKVEVFCVLHPINKVPVYLIRNKKYLSIPKAPDTFAFFCKAVVEMVYHNILSWIPDIIHCNDHHTGLIPLLIRERKIPIKTIMTIHNLSYQGKASIDILSKLGIDVKKCKVLGWEIESKKVNFLMEGIIHADLVTTVSPTYAKEIFQEEYGMGLEEILRGKEGRVFGILNGIDMLYNRSVSSSAVRYPYVQVGKENRTVSSKIYSWEEGKKLNKLFLQKKLGLKISASIPLFSFIGRFDPQQKGIEILHKMIRRINLSKYEFVILGKGSSEWEERYQWLCKFYPKNVSCNFEFDNSLAHQIYAASDFILIPSKFEPCGLIQMFAMFYGTLPIAHKTGGLVDSITDNVNGFLFEKHSSESLERTVKKALNIWYDDRVYYKMMVEAALVTNFSWEKSAGQYIDLYSKLINNTL